MKRVDLTLSELSFTEKLNLMEALWADLSRNEQDIQSPPWHQEVLEERDKRVESGESKFQNWEDAKRELRDRLT